MNTMLIAQILATAIAIYHIFSQTWLYESLKNKNNDDHIIFGIGIGFDVFILGIIFAKLIKDGKIKLPRRKAVAAPAAPTTSF